MRQRIILDIETNDALEWLPSRLTLSRRQWQTETLLVHLEAALEVADQIGPEAARSTPPFRDGDFLVWPQPVEAA